jgi:FMN phosphatase YigB (HAD superfamily)
MGSSVSPWDVFGDPDAWQLQERAESGELDPIGKTRELNRLFGLDAPEASWAQAWAAGCTRPVHGMMQLVAGLERQVVLGCLSNTVPWHWAAGLRLVPVLEAMPHHLLSYELGCRKPGQRIYELSLAALDLEGPEVVFVDDRPENIEGARGVGIRGVLFEGAEQLAAELAGLGL